MKNYSALMESLNALGKVENVSIQRNDRPDAQANQADAPADISIQVYSQGNIVSAGDRGDCHAAPHDRPGRGGPDVERAHDRRGARVYRAVGVGDRRCRLGDAAHFTRTPCAEAARRGRGRAELGVTPNSVSSRAAQTARDLTTGRRLPSAEINDAVTNGIVLPKAEGGGKCHCGVPRCLRGSG